MELVRQGVNISPSWSWDALPIISPLPGARTGHQWNLILTFVVFARVGFSYIRCDCNDKTLLKMEYIILINCRVITIDLYTH